MRAASSLSEGVDTTLKACPESIFWFRGLFHYHTRAPQDLVVALNASDLALW